MREDSFETCGNAKTTEKIVGAEWLNIKEKIAHKECK
jgi:hypothetical protein